MRSRGFTLIELLVVIGIMIVLGGMVLAAIDTARKYAERMAAKALVNNLESALALYQSDWGMYVDDIGGYGNRELYRKLSGDLDGNGKVTTGTQGAVYHKFSGEEVNTLTLSTAPIVDALGYNIGYDMTYNPLTRVNTYNQQTGLDHTDNYRNPSGKNPRKYDIWSIGPNGLCEHDTANTDDYRNWTIQ